ncbi:MAG: hypothetical protein MJ192_02720 [Clostridia bacterium]|nr:hypothetical protein [Clostridia bacterium]
MADKNGNVGKKIINFTVNANAGYNTIKVVPHNTTMMEVLNGQLYYIDLVATDISKVNKVTTILKVNNVNNWEPMGIVVADGFAAEYALEAGDLGEMTLTITRTGDVEATGEAVIASIPVRAWYPHNVLNRDSAWLIANTRIFPMDIKVVTKAGAIEFVDETDYVGAFSAEMIQIDNEAMCEYGYIGVIKGKENNGTNYKTTLHVHNAQAVADLAATCTKDGYTGRTFCAVCNSVVDWGTTVPATGHTFELVDGVLKCACGELANGEFDGILYADGVAVEGWSGDSYYVGGVALTGVQKIDGYYYDFGTDGVCEGKAKYTGLFFDGEEYRYAQVGELSSGWKQDGDDWYYFDETTLAPIDTLNNGKVIYSFYETGKLVSGKWYTDANGTRYYYGPSYHHGYFRSGYAYLAEVDGKTYNFDGAGYLTGPGVVALRQSTSVPPTLYRFADDCSLIGIVDKDGVVEASNGDLYYAVNGDAKYAGLVKEDGYYYYFRGTDYKAIKSCTAKITYTNGLLPQGTYTFDENYHIVFENGLVENGGETFYFVNGEAQKGLQLIDGNYYFFRNSTSAMMKSMTYTVTTAYGNGLISKATTFVFDENGVGTELKFTGFKTVGSNTYYYVEDVMQKGLQQIDGSYYFFRNSTGAMMTDNTYTVTPAYGNGLITKSTTFAFGANGVGTEVKFTGFKTVGSNTYYYVEDVMQKGLQQIDGSYYFFRNSTGAMMTDNTYTVTPAYGNGLITKSTTFAFGANGVGTEVKFTGFKTVGSNTYYYVDDVMQKGLQQIDGDYYFFRNSTGAMMKSMTYTVQIAYSNGLLTEATRFVFGSTGIGVIG